MTLASSASKTIWNWLGPSPSAISTSTHDGECLILPQSTPEKNLSSFTGFMHPNAVSGQARSTLPSFEELLSFHWGYEIGFWEIYHLIHSFYCFLPFEREIGSLVMKFGRYSTESVRTVLLRRLHSIFMWYGWVLLKLDF